MDTLLSKQEDDNKNLKGFRIVYECPKVFDVETLINELKSCATKVTPIPDYNDEFLGSCICNIFMYILAISIGMVQSLSLIVSCSYIWGPGSLPEISVESMHEKHNNSIIIILSVYIDIHNWPVYSSGA